MTGMFQAEMVLFHVHLKHVPFPENHLEIILVFKKAQELKWVRSDFSLYSFVLALKEIVIRRGQFNRLASQFLKKLYLEGNNVSS